MHAFSSSLIFSVFVLQLRTVYSSTYTYQCFPNNTIFVSGLPTDSATMYYLAIQLSDDTNCNVAGSLSDGTALISGCNKDEPIVFTYGSYSDMSDNQIHGGQQVKTVNITCNQLGDSGVAVTISNNLLASIPISQQRTVQPKYEVISSLNPTAANIGQDVTWAITYPASYSLQITTCTAYPGKAVHATDSIALISSWCSAESELITNFASNGANTQATASMQAFKFYNYDNVFLVCDLLVCPQGSSSCITSCSQGRKKRSDYDQHGEFIKRVSNVLQVIDIGSSASDKTSGFFLPFLLAIFLSIL